MNTLIHYGPQPYYLKKLNKYIIEQQLNSPIPTLEELANQFDVVAQDSPLGMYSKRIIGEIR